MPTRTKKSGSNAEYHLSSKKVNRILKACQNPRDKVLIQTLVYTGIRRAEAATLCLEDIVWDDNLLLIRNGKGNKQRLVPLPDFLLNDIKSLVSRRTTGPVFSGRNGGALCFRQINRIVAKAGNLAGINNPNPKYKNITCHLFRHTFARLWKQQNGSIESLSYILGHSSQATTMDLYGRESLSDVQKNYRIILKRILKGN